MLPAPPRLLHRMVCSTQSEVVVPLVVPATSQVLAVLDVDSDDPAAFDDVDAAQLERLCMWLAATYGAVAMKGS